MMSQRKQVKNSLAAILLYCLVSRLFLSHHKESPVSLAESGLANLQTVTLLTLFVATGTCWRQFEVTVLEKQDA